eukprot:CAMPEP_0119302262 /NCGR_PEP_ID=MMETSP1333-20130426/3889_1 /TAXON_ID=418940 /ORGANISM="Scyphosphaera apsteinii, Strain RCC1455" /LENGTH=182 /DNA_ID=CAMNT_0007304569 /DNA_START=452 /DNA_END=997 /DNA_ORIENTATION=-
MAQASRPGSAELIATYTARWFGNLPYNGTGFQSRHSVLIHRKGKVRAFSRTTYTRLLASMTAARSPVRVYAGTEKLRDVLQLFATAEAIVGYHGAGFANCVFARYACAHEMSSFTAMDTSIKRSNIWRSNGLKCSTEACASTITHGALLKHAKTLSWHVHFIPLAQLMLANWAWKSANHTVW